METTLTLPEYLMQDLNTLVITTMPNECCALLLGGRIEKHCTDVRVLDLVPMKNSDESETTFSIDPQELISEYQNAEQRNLQVVGIFHSHPSLPYPSLTDKEFMEINPVVWLIHSTITHQTRAYIYDDKIEEVWLRVKE